MKISIIPILFPAVFSMCGKVTLEQNGQGTEAGTGCLVEKAAKVCRNVLPFTFHNCFSFGDTRLIESLNRTSIIKCINVSCVKNEPSFFPIHENLMLSKLSRVSRAARCHAQDHL